MDEIDTRPEAVEALARRLHTRQPYKHPLQIAADLHVGPKDELLGDFLLILGQGDYPTLRQLADQTRELQDQAAATLRALSARSPAPADAAREAALLAALARIEGYALGLVGSEDRDAPWAVRKMLDYIEEQRRALAAPLPTEARDGE